MVKIAFFANYPIKLTSLLHQLASSHLDFALLRSNPTGHTCKVENEFLLALGSNENEKITSLDLVKDAWHFGWVEYAQTIPARFNSCFFSPDELFHDLEIASAYLNANSVGANREIQSSSINLVCETSKEEFIEKVTQIKQHIRLGNIYELNFCVKHSAENVVINPALVFEKLNELSQAPYSVFARIGDRLVISASPERFMKKRGNNLTIEPMKGTARREKDGVSNLLAISALQTNEKERAENIMIVDLTRNDLSRICIPGTVAVDELCKVYSFKNVNQMVSKVTGQLNKNYSLNQIFDATFPMGSMTGAPKIRAMELINEFETFRRGTYSGSFGYAKPDGDFDFNVLIRTIFYDTSKKSLYFATGGAITINSDPEKEWDEMMLKAETLKGSIGM